MAFEKTTLDVFKRRLKNGEYDDATGARRAVGKSKAMTDAEKKKAYAAVDGHTGPWSGGNKTKTAKKPAGAKKTAAPVKTAKKAVAKKPAGKPAAAPKPVAKKGARAKRTAKTPKGGRGKAKAEEARPAEATAQVAEAPPPIHIGTVFTSDDVVRNPVLFKNMAVESIGAFTQAYHTYQVMAEKDPSFPIDAMRAECAEGMQKAVTCLGIVNGSLHDASTRAGIIPGSTMAPPAAPPAASPPSGPQDVLNRAADAAEKVHGTGKFAGPASPAPQPVPRA